jgi:hypothetical protein
LSETFEIAKLDIDDKELLVRVESFFNSGVQKEGDLLEEEFGLELQYCNILQTSTTSIDIGEGPFKDIKYGHFFLEDTDLGNDLDLIPLVMWSDRAYFVQDNPSPVCKSPDGKTPMETTFATKCANCQFGKWDNKTKTPPKCTKSLNILFIPNTFTHTPFVFKFSRTGAKVGNEIIKVAKRNARSVYETTFKLTTKQENKKKRKYYVPVKNGSYLTDPGLFPALKFIQGKYLEVVRGFTTRHLNNDDTTETQEDAPTNIA